MFNNDIAVEENLGRLKHTTKETCEDCLRGKLQLRVRVTDGIDKEYLFCPICGFEKRPKRSKVEGIWKKQIASAEEVVEVIIDVKSRDTQHRGNRSDNGKPSERDNRNSGRTGTQRFPK